MSEGIAKPLKRIRASMSSSDKSALQLQSAGQEAYRLQDYRAALSYLSEALAITTSPNILINVLDNRAAVYEKLDKGYNLALRDARKIISLQNASAKGYLRAGKILQLMGRHDLALDNYSYGLKQIRPDDVNGKRLLDGMYQKVNEWSSLVSQRSRKIDPLEKLPYELVDMIFKYVPFRSLMLLQRVNRSWRQFLTSYHRTYTALDFSAATKPVSKHTIKTYLKRSRGLVKFLFLRKMAFSDSETLVYIISRCKMLEDMVISNCHFLSSGIVQLPKIAKNLKNLDLGCAADMGVAINILQNAQSLEGLQCHNLEITQRSYVNEKLEAVNLKRLKLAWTVGSSSVHFSLFTTLLDFLLQLEELELIKVPDGLLHGAEDFTSLTKLQKLVLRETTMNQYPALPSCLIHLDISNNSQMRFDRSRVLQSPLDQLEVFGIESNPWITEVELIDIIGPSSRTKSLITLKFGMCPRIDTTSLSWLTESGLADCLLNLSVHGNSSFGDEISKELGALHRLESLDASYTKLSGIGVINLICQGSSNLVWLGLDMCENVGKDAVEYARTKGINISHKLGVFKGGKKVRY
ncbi:hypothetical protein EDC01DRAFT_198004 [Geopyxis carbonaria]|nr:hypothetical protein EDC01DRAFT_198004 [Geopyxis carbonaria]